MRTVRNITVAVEPELYRQTRKIAADYDTTVTDMVRFLLLALPDAVKAARYPGGRPQFGLAAARAALSAAPAPLPATPSPSPDEREKLPCTPVNASQPHSPQPLAKQQSAAILDKYPRTPTLKTLITKALRAIPQFARFRRCMPVN